MTARNGRFLQNHNLAHARFQCGEAGRKAGGAAPDNHQIGLILFNGRRPSIVSGGGLTRSEAKAARRTQEGGLQERREERTAKHGE